MSRRASRSQSKEPYDVLATPQIDLMKQESAENSVVGGRKVSDSSKLPPYTQSAPITPAHSGLPDGTPTQSTQPITSEMTSARHTPKFPSTSNGISIQAPSISSHESLSHLPPGLRMPLLDRRAISQPAQRERSASGVETATQMITHRHLHPPSAHHHLAQSSSGSNHSLHRPKVLAAHPYSNTDAPNLRHRTSRSERSRVTPPPSPKRNSVSRLETTQAGTNVPLEAPSYVPHISASFIERIPLSLKHSTHLLAPGSILTAPIKHSPHLRSITNSPSTTTTSPADRKLSLGEMAEISRQTKTALQQQAGAPGAASRILGVPNTNLNPVTTAAAVTARSRANTALPPVHPSSIPSSIPSTPAIPPIQQPNTATAAVQSSQQQSLLSPFSGDPSVSPPPANAIAVDLTAPTVESIKRAMNGGLTTPNDANANNMNGTPSAFSINGDPITKQPSTHPTPQQQPNGHGLVRRTSSRASSLDLGLPPFNLNQNVTPVPPVVITSEGPVNQYESGEEEEHVDNWELQFDETNMNPHRQPMEVLQSKLDYTPYPYGSPHPGHTDHGDEMYSHFYVERNPELEMEEQPATTLKSTSEEYADSGHAERGLGAELSPLGAWTNKDEQHIVEVFLEEVGSALFACGLPMHAVQFYVTLIGHRLHVDVEMVAITTSFWMTFPPSSTAHMVSVKKPGLSLSRMVDVCGVCETMLHGGISPIEGLAQLQIITRAKPAFAQWMFIPALTLCSFFYAPLFNAGWTECGVAALTGFFIALLEMFSENHANIGRGHDLLCGIIGSLLAVLCHSYVTKINMLAAVFGGIIWALPGLRITLSMLDLGTGNPVTGTAKFMSGLITIINLGIGIVAGFQIGKYTGVDTDSILDSKSYGSVPDWFTPLCLIGVTGPQVMLLDAKMSHSIQYILGAGVAYYLSYYGGIYLGPSFGSWIAAAGVGIICNIYGRITSYPAIELALYSILLLVPGSIGVRSVLASSSTSSVDFLERMISVAIAIVTGLFTANVIIPPFRAL